MVKRNELHTFVVLVGVPPTLEELRKKDTSLQMVVLAFTVLILKRL